MVETLCSMQCKRGKLIYQAGLWKKHQCVCFWLTRDAIDAEMCLFYMIIVHACLDICKLDINVFGRTGWAEDVEYRVFFLIQEKELHGFLLCLSLHSTPHPVKLTINTSNRLHWSLSLSAFFFFFNFYFLKIFSTGSGVTFAELSFCWSSFLSPPHYWLPKS